MFHRQYSIRHQPACLRISLKLSRSIGQQLLIAAILIAVLTSCAPPAKEAPAVVATEALTNPSKHAWDLFIALNQPAVPLAQSPGEQPDRLQAMGREGDRIWETWRYAYNDTFRKDGKDPGPWESTQKNANKQLHVSASLMAHGFPESAIATEWQQSFKLKAAFSLLDVNPDRHGLFNPDNFFGGGETRLNREAFDFIRGQRLYNPTGQKQRYWDARNGRAVVSFPPGSIVVKAIWREFTSDEINQGVPRNYYTSTNSKNGRKVGLLALHIITKELPNWFWCTFHHVQPPKPELPSVDTYGRPDALGKTVWRNYALSGTQTDFVDPRGRATLLSDRFIENGFQISSCISCHALSAVSVDTGGTMTRLPLPILQQPRRIKPPLGAPDCSLFFSPALPPTYCSSTGNFIQQEFIHSFSLATDDLGEEEPIRPTP